MPRGFVYIPFGYPIAPMISPPRPNVIKQPNFRNIIAYRLSIRGFTVLQNILASSLHASLPSDSRSFSFFALTCAWWMLHRVINQPRTNTKSVSMIERTSVLKPENLYKKIWKAFKRCGLTASTKSHPISAPITVQTIRTLSLARRKHSTMMIVDHTVK